MVEPAVNAASNAATRAFRIYPSPLPPRRSSTLLARGVLWRFRDPDSGGRHCAPIHRSTHGCRGEPAAAPRRAGRRARSNGLEPFLFLGDQDLALAGVVGLADDPFLLHPLHQRGGAVVADLQAALNVAGRGLAVAGNDLHRLGVEIAALRLAHAGRVEHGAVLALLAVVDRDGLEILR